MASTTGAHESVTDFREARAELAVVLASPMFARAANLSKILSYICDRYFEGDAASVKEYTVAVAALGRSPDFHPDKDSIVRVEASRLRKRLKRYYEGEGADHAIHIVLPESGYVPHFVSRVVPEQQSDVIELATPPPVAERPRTRWRKPAWIAGAIILAAVATLIVVSVMRTRSRPEGDTVQTRPVERSPVGNIAPVAAIPSASGEVRILAGFAGSKYIDSMGRTWSGDRWFAGGRAYAEHDRRIARTLDQGLYQTARMGDFRYDIPLKPGVYELHLHFAEIQYGGTTTLESGVEGVRRFHVLLNGKPVLSDFDIIVSAGAPSTADERVFKDVSPADDGFVHLEFSSYHGTALVSAIEILPSTPGKMRPILIVAGSNVYVDKRDQFWGADRYFLGGRVSRPTTPVDAPDDPGLYGNARWGHFTYTIPVAAGRYTATLRFAEPTFGIGGLEGPGQRLFDVYCNGLALLRNFDIFKEAGGPNRGVVKTFRGLEPNAQGKLMMWFVPSKNYANVYAIEIQPE